MTFKKNPGRHAKCPECGTDLAWDEIDTWFIASPPCPVCGRPHEYKGYEKVGCDCGYNIEWCSVGHKWVESA